MQDWAWALLAEVSLDAAAFHEVKQWCLDEGDPAQAPEEAQPQPPKGAGPKAVQPAYDDGELALFEDLLYPGAGAEDADGVVPQLAA